jgi:quinol monooxygenase YgiN
MIHVLATIELHPGRREAFLAEFAKIVPLVKAEAGCLEYGPAIDCHTDIPAQGPISKNTAVIIEKWESVEALKAHLVAPHMVEYRPKVRDYVVSTKLQILAPQ